MADSRRGRVRCRPARFKDGLTVLEIRSSTTREKISYGTPGRSPSMLKRKPTVRAAEYHMQPLALRPPHNNVHPKSWDVADILSRESVKGAREDSFEVRWAPVRVLTAELGWWLTHYVCDLLLIINYPDDTSELRWHTEFVWVSDVGNEWAKAYDANILLYGSLRCVICLTRFGSGLAMQRHMDRRHGGGATIESMMAMDSKGDLTLMVNFFRGRLRVMVRDKLIWHKPLSELTCVAGPLPFISGCFGHVFAVPGATLRYHAASGNKVAQFQARAPLVPVLGEGWWINTSSTPHPADEHAWEVHHSLSRALSLSLSLFLSLSVPRFLSLSLPITLVHFPFTVTPSL
jgi:hypothetical protein